MPATPRAPRRRAPRLRRARSSRRSGGRRADAATRARSAVLPVVILRTRASVGVDVSLLRRLDVEELREDPLCRRRGGLTTLATVLDHRADDELRVVRRTIAAPPRLALVAREARGGARRMHELLGGARLAGDRIGEAAEDTVRGAERILGALEKAL